MREPKAPIAARKKFTIWAFVPTTSIAGPDRERVCVTERVTPQDVIEAARQLASLLDEMSAHTSALR